MRNFLNRLYLASGWGAAFFVLAICLLVMAQVTLNIADKVAVVFSGTAMGLTIPSYSDFTGFFLASASFLALAHTFREGGHIRVTLLVQHLPGKLRAFLELVSVGLATAMTVYFAWYTALLTHESFTYNDLSSGMVAVPIWIPQSGMLLGLVILSIALIDDFIGLVMGREASYANKGENLLSTDDKHPSVGNPET